MSQTPYGSVKPSGDKWVARKLKSAHAERAVPLLPPAVEALRSLKAHRKTEADAAKAEGRAEVVQLDPLVWPSASGGVRRADADAGWASKRWRLSPGEPLRLTEGVPARAGIARRVRFHDLRHTCASHLVQGTWGPRRELFALFGGEDTNGTAVAPVDVSAARAKVEAAVREAHEAQRRDDEALRQRVRDAERERDEARAEVARLRALSVRKLTCPGCDGEMLIPLDAADESEHTCACGKTLFLAVDDGTELRFLCDYCEGDPFDVCDFCERVAESTEASHG